MKNTVFLLGAGAAQYLSGPSTKKLTDKVLMANHYKDRNGNPVFQTIYNYLAEQYNDKSSVNFETIFQFLNVIESYYFSKGHQNKNLNFHSLVSTLPLKEEKFNNLFNYQMLNNNEGDPNSYKLPDGSIHNDGMPESHLIFEYKKSLLRIILSNIVYDFNSSTCELKKLASYLNQLQKRDILRIYTLNYDDLSKELNTYVSSKIFNGFDLKDDKNSMIFNKEKVMKVRNENCYYNLHGSKHWYLDNIGFEEVFKYEFGSTQNYEANGLFVNTNPNSLTKIYPIITGYDKIQNFQVEPFHSFHYSFIRDIYECEKLVIIGYGFGDPHINNVIKNNLKRLAKTEIVTKTDSANCPIEFFNAKVKNVIGAIIDEKTRSDAAFQLKEEKGMLFYNGVDVYINEKLNS